MEGKEIDIPGKRNCMCSIVKMLGVLEGKVNE